jgi:hypothetical protein
MLYPVPRVDVSERPLVIAFVCLVLATLGFTMLADLLLG